MATRREQGENVNEVISQLEEWKKDRLRLIDFFDEVSAIVERQSV